MIIKVTSWNIEEETGYKPLTTLYEDFGIAEAFGEKAIKDTLKQALDFVKGDYKQKTELVMVLNHKSWEHYYRGNIALSKIYSDLYYKYDNECLNKFKGEALDYYLTTTD